MNLDRDTLTYLVNFHTKKALAQHFGISLPTLRSYLKGNEPASVAVTENLNRKMHSLLPKREHDHPEWRQP